MPIRKYDLAAFGHDAQSITVAIESEPDLTFALKRINQIIKILDMRRIRMMIREVAVHFAKKLFHRTAQPAIKLWRRVAGYAVTTIHDDTHAACELNVRDDALKISLAYVARAVAAAAAGGPG